MCLIGGGSMVISRSFGRLLAGALLFAVGSAASADSYIVLANGNKLAKGLEQELRAAGADSVTPIPQIGVAIAESDAEGFADRASGIKGIRSVTADVRMQYINPPKRTAESVSIDEMAGNPPVSGDDDFFFDLQWGHDAVDAPEAWEMGARGAGARVAVLDSGFDFDHPDLAPNVNLGLSANFVPGETLAYGLPDTFSHGTHTAGTIGAADNGFGTIGVAPEAELVLVKVLSDGGSGAFAWIIQGIVHAALVDADVANMSLGAAVPHNVPGAAELFVALGRATNFAHQNGVTLVSSAGNDARDMDHDASLTAVPAELPHVVSISATAPVGWGLNPTVGLDQSPVYTNFGQSGIDFAAPGGGYDGAFLGLTFPCSVAGTTAACYVYDFVFSTGNNGWYWSVGTSMAAPHASGVAALIVGNNGGDMKPAHVVRALRHGADDLGKRGNDDFYGQGRVNALRSIQ